MPGQSPGTNRLLRDRLQPKRLRTWKKHRLNPAAPTQTEQTNLKPNKGTHMKTRHALALTTLFALVVTSIPLLAASEDDNRIVSAAKQSYVYRTYLSDDHIKIQAKNQAEKDLVTKLVTDIRGVNGVVNNMEVKT
jgi:hypothetical protein